MKKSIYNEISINAKAEKIWQVLTDFKNFPHWNPFIKSLSGMMKEGETIKVELKAPGAKTMTFKPRILIFNENKQFQWQGHLFIKGLFDGTHNFEIHELDDGSCKFIQSESFTGLLIPMFNKMLDTQTIKGFKEMNEALKHRVENI